MRFKSSQKTQSLIGNRPKFRADTFVAGFVTTIWPEQKNAVVLVCDLLSPGGSVAPSPCCKVAAHTGKATRPGKIQALTPTVNLVLCTLRPRAEVIIREHTER